MDDKSYHALIRTDDHASAWGLAAEWDDPVHRLLGVAFLAVCVGLLGFYLL